MLLVLQLQLSGVQCSLLCNPPAAPVFLTLLRLRAPVAAAAVAAVGLLLALLRLLALRRAAGGGRRRVSGRPFFGARGTAPRHRHRHPHSHCHRHRHARSA